MDPLHVLRAFFSGVSYCFIDKQTRGYALIPWAVGALVYFALAYLAYELHADAVALLVERTEGVLNFVLYWLAWIAATLVLAALVLLFSFVVVFVATSSLLVNLAKAVAKQEGLSVPIVDRTLVQEGAFTIRTELAKLIILTPIGLGILIMTLIPALAPFAIVLAAWTLAFESSDPVLEVFGFRFRQRMSFAFKHWLLLTCYGLLLSAIALIPLAGILLPPIAVAGSCSLLGEKLLQVTGISGSE